MNCHLNWPVSISSKFIFAPCASSLRGPLFVTPSYEERDRHLSLMRNYIHRYSSSKSTQNFNFSSVRRGTADRRSSSTSYPSISFSRIRIRSRTNCCCQCMQTSTVCRCHWFIKVITSKLCVRNAKYFKHAIFIR